MARRTKAFLLEDFFKALADRTRLRLLNLMNGQEICVCYLVEVLKASQPKISRHLAYLRRSGVVDARREGKWMHYSIAEAPTPVTARVLLETLTWIASEKQMQDDRARLEQTCCSPETFVSLCGVPSPIQTMPSPREN